MPSPKTSRSVIITGGAGGLGKAMSAHLASRGDTITILDVDAASGAAVAAELTAAQVRAQAQTTASSGSGAGSVRFAKCDISSWEDQAAAFKAVYEDCGRIDVVLANAGINEGGRSWVVPGTGDGDGDGDGGEKGGMGEPEEPRLKVLDVNLVGNVYCMLFSLVHSPLSLLPLFFSRCFFFRYVFVPVYCLSTVIRCVRESFQGSV